MSYAMKYFNNLGDLLKEYRELFSLNQEDFAEQLDTNLKTYQRWERNEHPAKEENLFKISQITWIPLHVTKTVNAGMPIYYSVKKRKWSPTKLESKKYFFPELLTPTPPDDDGLFIRFAPLDSEEVIKLVKESDRNIYPSQNSFRIDTAYRAHQIAPELNFVVYDLADLVVGHQVCLPLSQTTYAKIKNGQMAEGDILPKDIFNALVLRLGVLYFCAGRGASASIQHNIISKNVHILLKYWMQYLRNINLTLAAHVMNVDGYEVCKNLGMQLVFEDRQEFQAIETELPPAIFEARIKDLAKSLFNLE